MAVFREVSTGSSESSLQGTGRPAAFNGQGPRPGAAASYDWSVAFVDADGALMLGGSASVQWYGLEVGADGDTVNVAIGSTVAATPYVRKSISIGQGVWPWCRLISMTPPSVSPKAIQVTIQDDGDGDYSIAVVGEVDPYTFAASGSTLAEVTDGLAALFTGHPTLTVYAAGDGYVMLTSTTDFALEVSGPLEASMEQLTTTPWRAQPALLRVFMTAAQPALDTTAVAEAAETGAAAALNNANITTSSFRSSAYQAIQEAVQDDVIPIAPTAQQVADAVDGDDWQRYGGNFGSSDTEIQLVAANPSYRVAVLGWLSTGGATQLTVELRSGDANDAANTQIDPGAPALGTIGAGSAINLRPAKVPMWTTANGKGLTLRKSAGSITCHCVVWYRSIPLLP